MTWPDTSPTWPDASPPRRVVVTGLGAVTSIGTGVRDFLAGLRAGRSGAKPITSFDVTGFEHSQGCEIDDFAAEDFVLRLPLSEYGRASHFAAAAARMAVDDAALPVEVLREARSLVTVGTTDGESRDLDRLVQQEVAHGPERMDPEVARRVPAGKLSVAAARELGLVNVEAVTLPTACAAGNYAIGYGYDAVRTGEVDFALCGGADAVCLKTFAGFYRLGTIAPEKSPALRPAPAGHPDRRRRRRSCCWRVSNRRSDAARASTRKCSATGSTATRTTPSRRTRTASPAAYGWLMTTRGSPRTTSTSSPPTAPVRRPTTSANPAPCGRSSGTRPRAPSRSSR